MLFASIWVLCCVNRLIQTAVLKRILGDLVDVFEKLIFMKLFINRCVLLTFPQNKNNENAITVG